MNRLENPQAPGEAQLRYLDSDFQVLTQGSYVRCAVTGKPIQLDDLKYWSAELQEPFVDARAALKRYQEQKL
jgi:hypothetical protein